MPSTVWQNLPRGDYRAWLDAFLRDVFDVAPAAHVTERAGASYGEPPAVDEMLLQAVWAQRHLREDLLTESGRRLAVVEPGRWNAAGGPDFLKAELRLDGHAVRGDVEVHVDASGWRQHRHEADFEYNGVVLHVFLRNDDGRKYDRLQNGEKLERLCLEGQLEPDLDSIRAAIEPEQLVPGGQKAPTECQRAIERLDQRVVEEFLDLAARERLESKAARLARYGGGSARAEDLTEKQLEQILYQALVTYLGQGASKPLYYLVARRAPIDELRQLTRRWSGRERLLAVQAILLHVAALMPTGEESHAADDALDEAALEHVNLLNRYWAELGGYFGDRLLPPSRRWFGGVRPVNFPTRQLAGLAHLVVRWFQQGESLVEAFRRQLPTDPSQAGKMTVTAGRKLIKALAAWLEVEAPRDFWAQRYTLTSAPAAAPMKLIGPARARMMAFNALLPSLLLIARARSGDESRGLEKLAWRLYAVWPPLPPTNITRHMSERLFGDSPRARDVLTSEARFQALYQLYADCCNSDSPHGNACRTFGPSPRP